MLLGLNYVSLFSQVLPLVLDYRWPQIRPTNEVLVPPTGIKPTRFRKSASKVGLQAHTITSFPVLEKIERNRIKRQKPPAR